MSALEGLRLAGEWGGSLLSGEGGPLLLVERLRTHTAPRLAVLVRRIEELRDPLAAWEAGPGTLTLVGLLPLPGADLPQVLARETRRIGALVAALDAGLPHLPGPPHLVRRLPGRVSGGGTAFAPLPLTGIQAFELTRRCGDLPAWAQEGQHWWEGPAPAEATVEVPPLTLPTATPLTDALRAALRTTSPDPVDFLPLPGDPGPLHALRKLTPEATAFRAEAAGWREALRRLAELPSPAHFCARC